MVGVDLSGLNTDQQLAISATLAGAVETAKAMGEATPAWLEAARSGFSLGFAACCALAAVTLLALAALAHRIYSGAHIDESGTMPH
jgi:DHA2 family multidrug resistance protein-like MFS transporter